MGKRRASDKFSRYSDAVKIILNKAKTEPELKKRIKGVVAELIKADKKYDVALEIALAAAAQNIVTANTEDAKFLIEYLKKNNYGRATFLPITSVKPRQKSLQAESALNERGALGLADEIVSFDREYENIISSLLGNTLIVDNISNARLIAEKYRFAFKIVTLDGDVFATQGSMSGGSRAHGTGILSGDRRADDAENELKAKQAEMDKLRAQKTAAEKERDKSLDDLSVINDMYDGKRQQLAAVREKLTAVESSLIEVGKDMENTTDLIEEIEKRITRLDEEYSAVSSGGKELEERRKGAKKRADEHEAEFEELRKSRDKVNDDLSSTQINVAELKARVTALTEDNARLSSSIIDAEKSNVDLNNSNDGAREIIEKIKLDREKVALTKSEQDKINGLREKIAGVETEKTNLKGKLDANDAKKQSITDEINTLTEKKHNEEIAITKIDSDLEYLQQSVFEDYQETYETAVKVRAENYDAAFGEKEIVRLRKRRSSLGAINAAAIDDFKTLKERYDEMVAEKEDIEKAEKDLREAIEKIKGEMISQFDEGFKKINENFQRIFKELFGGGRAMLELDYTETTDKLEAGVEIIAEPPGKRLQKLSLLSGGEKALTAIAILFSILKLRPMPFCVLDEIEAALDEANVDRFARYLQKFSEETQFIVITHRKPTMEMADSLFGVTMQEKGVSKMVSVKLSDVASFDDQLA
ncbi:MAG: chromosome segregation protein SMC [Clostridia bacterium]|nr:chromosome segregation protein SMC [Clostridia bacterium]